ncbi:adenylate kinase [bacterium]|jgi:adenylate kinase|nr:adenylate kinase [bacterium]
MINVLMFGPPGSGKGTQSVTLAEKYNLLHLSTGDMLRAELAAATELGKKMEAIMASGELVPDDVVIAMIAQKIDATTGRAGFVFDGFPRTVEQAGALEKMLEARNMKIDLMLVLEVNDAELMDRMKKRALISGRADDADEAVINNRIAVYRAKTEPVIEYGRKTGVARIVDGVGTIDDIFARLCSHIEKVI